MPSLATFHLSPPEDAREFEKILRDYCNCKYSGHSCLFARPGQKQYGVDVVSNLENDSIIAVQCKDYQITDVSDKKIDKWISDAEKFRPSIKHLIIAIADKTDGIIQSYVMEISQKRKHSGMFTVEVLYWEEISAFLKANPMILQQYYPFIDNEKTDSEKTDSAFKVAYSNVHSLQRAFIDLLLKYSVYDFLKEDPFVGINVAYLNLADQFDLEMEKLFGNAVLLQKSDAYNKIRDFFFKWGDYREYLVPMVQPSNDGRYVKINPVYQDDFETMSTKVCVMKKDIYDECNRIISCIE